MRKILRDLLYFAASQSFISTIQKQLTWLQSFPMENKPAIP